jgi:cysteine desulfurase
MGLTGHGGRTTDRPFRDLDDAPAVYGAEKPLNLPPAMDPIYLDHAATTPLRTEVREAMASALDNLFGNPSSIHRWGREASASLELARAGCAAALGASPGEIFFVRGGTESDNLAILGRTARLRAEGHMPGVVVSSVEHKAVLDAAHQATARDAGRLTLLTVGPDGTLDLEALDRAVSRGPSVVSVMWVNNETGIVLPVPEIARRLAQTGATLHTDAVQAVGKIPVRVDDVPVDLLTVTGHKISGPRGTGLLYVRTGTIISPLLHGGGQERGLRPGTEDVSGAVGMATALSLAVEEQERESRRLEALRTQLERQLGARLPGIRINGGGAPRAPHVSSIAIPRVDGATLLMALDLEGIAASGGSACDSGASKASHVISALYGADDPHATLRLSLGRSTTTEEVGHAAEVLCEVITRLGGSDEG